MALLAPPRTSPPILVALVGVAVVVSVAACGSTRAPLPGSSASLAPTSTIPLVSTTATPTTATPTTVPPTTITTTRAATTSTTGVPVAPQPTAVGAASALISGWASANMPVARSVATARAVATLFATPYPSGLAIPRGCTVAFTPIVCTYGPPGGGPVNSRVFELYVFPTHAGWYVRSVVIES